MTSMITSNHYWPTCCRGMSAMRLPLIWCPDPHRLAETGFRSGAPAGCGWSTGTSRSCHGMLFLGNDILNPGYFGYLARPTDMRSNVDNIVPTSGHDACHAWSLTRGGFWACRGEAGAGAHPLAEHADHARDDWLRDRCLQRQDLQSGGSHPRHSRCSCADLSFANLSVPQGFVLVCGTQSCLFASDISYIPVLMYLFC